jgi:hypothetical protein
MVREKRMILQMDCASMLNKKDIKHTVEILVKEGKIKRQKVKNRGKVGNLTDVWLLHRNDVKQEEILEFEKELINKPFVSPLIKNHCYKKVESPVDAETKEDLVNVIDIQDYVKVNNQDVKVKEYKGNRVVTFKEVDMVHERPEGTARKRFNDNKIRFIENVDYFLIKPYDIQKSDKRTLGINVPNRGLILLTETGYMMLVKSFTDDLSWTVQRELVKSYFKIKELKEKQENNLPITKRDLSSINTYDILKVFASGITDLNDRVSNLESTMEQFKKALN